MLSIIVLNIESNADSMSRRSLHSKVVEDRDLTVKAE